jgi:hypothetical protein
VAWSYTASLARRGKPRENEEWHRIAGDARRGMAGNGLSTLALQGRHRPFHSFSNTMTITYNFRRGAEIDRIDAQTAGEELARITEQHDGLTPAVVVDESRPDDAPLHPVFEWDDAVAAELHRQHQADALIKAVQVVREKSEPDEPVFVKVRSVRNYQPVEKVVKRLDLFEEAFRDACERLSEAEAALHQLVSISARLRPEIKPQAEKAAKLVGKIHDLLPAGKL